MKAQDLITIFHKMLDEHWAYEWGAAEKGKVDCAGAFVYAYQQYGKSIYHGSNRIARTEIVELLPISEAKPGMAAFKRREPGDKGYALPDGYKIGREHYNGDLNDYYHIGLVDDDPAWVLNAQSTATGFRRSRITDNWHFVGRLKQVDATEEKPMQKFVVVGGALKLRKGAGTKYDVIKAIPNGETVEVIEYVDSEWYKVRHGNETGYVMEKYLVPVTVNAPFPGLPPGEDEESITISKSAWESLKNAMKAIEEELNK